MRFLILILILALHLRAEDIYIAQTAAGGDTGANCANAHAITWFNTAGNWGGGAGEIDPGDTVHFCGTLTTTAVIQLSGTAGNPITIVFESGAKFSKGTWNQSGSNGDAAIFGDSKSYITIRGQGGAVGVGTDIESTSNGTGLTTSNQSVGVWFATSDHINVFDLTVTNMYRRTPNSAENIALGGGIQFRSGGRDLVVSNCWVSQMNAGIYVGYAEGDSNLYVLKCKATSQGEAGILMGANNSSSTFTNVIISGNYFNDCTTWAGQPDIHCNHIHLHCVAAAPSNMTGVRIFNNHFYGDMGSQQTSFCFVEGSIRGTLVYNNLFELTSGGAGNGLLFFNGATNSLAANNTFVSYNTNYAGIGISDNGPVGATYTNNLFYNVATIIEDSVDGLLGGDYNVMFSGNASYPQWHPSAGFMQFDDWKTLTGFDENSKTNHPSLDATYVPLQGDTVARGAGVNLTARGITTDYFGNARPASGAWTIGYAEQSQARIWNVTTLNVGTLNVGTQ